MVAVVKSEWHQIERRYGFELTRDFLDEVYPDMEPDELDLMYVQIEAGERGVEEILEDAWGNNIDIDWDWLDEDDMWTDRKGGYDVTYEIDATRELPTYTWTAPEPDEEEVPCFSCDAMHKESELPELSGQYHCPTCHEGWVMMEFRDEEEFPPMDPDVLAQKLEELKNEFDFLCQFEDFKNDESIHQEIRDAFVKIIDEEDFE